MTILELLSVESEARRLIERINAAIKRIKADQFGSKHGYLGCAGSRETAAVRRASMDLTRALAKLRGAK